MTIMMPLTARFDANEWFIVAGLAVGYPAMWPLRRAYPLSVTVLVMLYGLIAAKLFDVIFGFTPFNFYDMNDSKKYEVWDEVLHLVYLPFAFFFVYLHDRWRIRGPWVVLYVLGFSLLGIGIEWLGWLAGVYHYRKWNLLDSFAAYLYMQAGLLLFFRMLMRRYRMTRIGKSD